MKETPKMEMLEDCIAQLTLNMQTNELMMPTQLYEYLKKYGDNPTETIIDILRKSIAKYQ